MIRSELIGNYRLDGNDYRVMVDLMYIRFIGPPVLDETHVQIYSDGEWLDVSRDVRDKVLCRALWLLHAGENDE